MRSFRSFATTAPKMLFQPINDQGGGHYRMMLPASLLRKLGYAVTQAHPHGLHPEALAILDPDVISFQMFQTERQMERIKAYKKAVPNAFYLYEIDDLFWAVPPDSFHAQNPLLPTAKSNIRTTAKLCDAITVTTPELAEEMSRLTGMKDVRIIPNLVPHSFINAALNGRRSDPIQTTKPRVGWAGGIGHGGDLKIIAEVMREIGDEVHWVFFGMLPPDVTPGENIEFHPGVPFADYPRMLGRLNLQLALAPLEENDFNRCKSDLRILEYAAAGFAVLASKVSTYRNCPVATVPNTVEAWVKAIRSSIADPGVAEDYAEHLHQWVVNEKCLDEVLHRHLKSYLSPRSEPFIPMAHTSHLGQVVTVGTAVEGLPYYQTIEDAQKAAPGSDVLYVRPNTYFTAAHAARLIDDLGHAASIAPLNNDGMYPAFGKFTRMSPDRAMQIDHAAALARGSAIPAPFPAGPCVLLSGVALARFGLPDVARFGSVEYAMADWGSRCLEGGRSHLTAINTFVATEAPLIQPKDIAQRTLEHISMWTPGFAEALRNYQQGQPLGQAREDIDLAFHAMQHQAPPVSDYQTWYELFETPSERDCARMLHDASEWENPPKISIIFPTYNTNIEHLRAALDSVLAQTYPHWELLAVDDASTDMLVRQTVQSYVARDVRIKSMFREKNGHICNASNDAIEIATGDWVVFLDHDDTLAPQALYAIAKEIMEHPEAKFIYSDSDKIKPNGGYDHPYFTPDFSYELLLAQNYVTHLCAYRLPEVKKLGGLRIGFEGSQDWDLVLRYLEDQCGNPPDPALIRHVPYVLYHWRESENSTAANILSKPYALEAGRKAVIQHLHRTNQAAFVAPHPVLPIFNMVRFLPPDPAPRVTIIVPTKDNVEQLDRCLSSIIGKTLYSNYSILVVDNGSTDKKTKNFLRQVVLDKRVRVISVPGKFNYADMNNRAVQHTDAKFVCLMNDDVEVIEGAWLNDMVGLALRPKVGAVGAKLLYPDDTVQQAGIIFSANEAPGQCALHMWQRLPAYHVGQTGRAVLTQPVIAVTGACMLVRRELYQEVGGLDAIRFPVDWNDVDFCLRLHKAGYRNIVASQSVLRHHEGQSKKRLGTWLHKDMLADERKLLELHGDVRDPYINQRLVFHPHMMMLKQVPFPQPWGDDLRPLRLLINGTDQMMIDTFKDGYLPFKASIEGHYLVFTGPEMENVRPIDLRMASTPLQIVMAKLAIDEVVFCGIGDGTLGSVGYFAALATEGWQLRYQPVAEAQADNAFEYYDPEGWRATWQKLLDAAKRDEPAGV